MPRNILNQTPTVTPVILPVFTLITQSAPVIKAVFDQMGQYQRIVTRYAP
jgi:hypothetical protein